MMPEKNKENCGRLEPLYDDYLRGELPQAIAEQLTMHLQDCGDCREALDDLRISTKLVGAAFEPVADSNPGFARLVMARINVAEHWLQEQKSFWRPIEALSLRLVFSAALVLAFLFAYEIRKVPAGVPPAPSGIFAPQADAFVRPATLSPSNSDEVLMAIAERHHEQ